MENELTTNEENLPTKQLQVESARAIKEVEAQFIIAKKFPRDYMKAFKQIIETCKRPTFAKQSLYLYPKGGATVSGPSIRMAEMIAQLWGNLDFGVNELSQEDDFSIVQSFCLDLETNVRQTKTFKVPHYRFTKSYGKKRLTDPRDIYETIANSGARRLRACIFGVIPQDIIEDAINQCKSTMASTDKEIPVATRIKSLVLNFDKLGVSQEMIEERYDMKINQLRDNELLELRTIFNSMKDNQSSKKDWFKFGKDNSEQSKDLNNKFANK